MEPTETDSVVLHASKRGWTKIDVRRDETPWVTFQNLGKGFSLNGKDYAITRDRRGAELSHAGESIVVVKAGEFDFAGKKWAIKRKPGIFTSGGNLECDGRIVGEFKIPGGFYFGAKVDFRLPRELPDEIQVLVVWLNAEMFDQGGGSA
jgi:hypothetical protein